MPRQSQNHYEVMVKMKSAQAGLYTLWSRDVTRAALSLAEPSGSFQTEPVREVDRLKLILRDGAKREAKSTPRFGTLGWAWGTFGQKLNHRKF